MSRARTRALKMEVARNQRQENVIALPTTATAAKTGKVFKMPLEKLDSFEGIKAISSLLREWERAKKENTFKGLAQKVGLHRKTVQRLAARETFSPRLHTLLACMSGVGFTMVRFD
jgi:DNA-binding phage protein